MMNNSLKPITMTGIFLYDANKIACLLALIISTLSSCEKALLKPDPGSDPKLVFDQLWNDVNNRYSYFELKDIQWDTIGIHYRNKISDTMNDKELFDILGNMLYELKDGHVNLTSDFNRSRNWEWFLNYPNNYDHNLIERHYLKNNHYITGPLLNQVIDSVLYVNYRSFTDNITQGHMDELMERAEGLKGVIIDIRHNGGGSLQNAYTISSCFIDKSVVFAQQRFKNGPEKNEFTSWEKMVVKPRDGKRFTGPIALLTNRRSYSASSFFAQMLKAIPNATLIGDHAGGGGGVPVFGELSNGWTYRFSASQTITPEGDHIELLVPVDIQVNMSAYHERRNIDTIIETALEYIKSTTMNP
jgi:hypothetical protein